MHNEMQRHGLSFVRILWFKNTATLTIKNTSGKIFLKNYVIAEWNKKYKKIQVENAVCFCSSLERSTIFTTSIYRIPHLEPIFHTTSPHLHKIYSNPHLRLYV